MVFFAMDFTYNPRYRERENVKGTEGKGSVVRKVEFHLIEACNGNNNIDFIGMVCIAMIGF